MATLSERPNLNEGFDWLATILFHVGLIAESRMLYAHALVINPDDMLARSHEMMGEWLAGNYRSVTGNAEDAAEGIDTSWAAYMSTFANLRLGELSTAEKAIGTAARKFPANVLFHSSRAILAALKKDEGASLSAIDLTMQNRKAYGHFHHAEFDIACALATLGHADRAIDHLTSATRGGFPCLPAVENDPLLEPLRSHPRYRDLVVELRGELDHYSRVWAGLRPMLASA